MATTIITVRVPGRELPPRPAVWTNRTPAGRLRRLMRHKQQRYSIQQLYEGYQVLN